MLALILTAATLLGADYTIRVSPEPVIVTKARLGTIRGMGVWRCLVCAKAAPIRVSALAVEQEITDLNLIDPESAAAVIRATPESRRRDRIIQGLLAAGFIAATLGAGNYIQVKGSEAAMIGLGLDLANRLRGRVEARTVVLDPAKLLTGMLFIQPGECESRYVFAGLVKRAVPRTYAARTFDVNVRASTITSIPDSGFFLVD